MTNILRAGLAALNRWAVVSEPGGRFLWILAREPQMDTDTLQARLASLQETGFDTGALLFPQQ